MSVYRKIGKAKMMMLGLLVLCCLAFTPNARAQWQLDLVGSVKSQEDKKKIVGAKINVYRNGSKVETVTTDAKGKFKISLNPDGMYKLEFSNSGYVTKRLEINTKNVPPADGEGGFEFPMEMVLFPELEGLDVSILNKPIAKLYYNPKSFIFDFDKDYTNSIKAEIERLQKELEDKLAEQEAMAAEQEKKYNDAIAAGDKAMSGKEYTRAKQQYTIALNMKPNEQYPKDKLAEAQKKFEKEQADKQVEKDFQEAIQIAEMAVVDDDLKKAEEYFSKAVDIKPSDEYAKSELKAVREKLLAGAKAEQAYIAAIGKADAYLEANKLIEAKAEYSKALEAKPGDTYATDKLAEVSEKIDADAKKESDYIAAIGRGDGGFEMKDYQAAKAGYERASEIKPDESYPKQQLQKIEGILAEMQKQDEAYTAAMNDGDNLANELKFDEAIAKYNEALKIKPDESLPKERIAQVESKRDELAKLKEEYDALIKDADERFAAKDYISAKGEYAKAIQMMPNEEYPKQKLEEVTKILNDEAEKEEKYKAAIANADAAFQGNDYTSAKFEYQAAAELKPDETYPKERLEEIEKLIVELENKNKEYETAIKQGDDDFEIAHYEEARVSYEKAAEIKPGEEYPKEQLKKISEKLKELAALDEEYTKKIAEADGLFQDKKLEDAKSSYEAALALKPEEEYPKTKIEEIGSLLADAQKLEEDYNAAIAAADQAFESSDFEASKTEYEKASGLKPEEEYPKKRLEEIQSKLGELAAIEESYNAAIAAADASFEASSWEEAKKSYEEASGLKPEESYPKERIAAIESKLADAAKAEQDYLASIQEAETAEKDGKLAEAIASFTKASEIKPEEEYPKTKITDLQAMLDEQNKQQAAYDAEIKLAEEAMQGSEYDIAKASFSKALEIKPDEAYPKDKLAEIEQILADQAKAIELENQQNEAYQAAIAAGDEAFNGEDYEAAKSKYEEALGIKPTEEYPKTKIAEANEKLNALLAAKELDEKYNALIADADAALGGSDYENAKSKYQEALGVKPDEQYPKDKIAEVDGLIAAAADQAEKDRLAAEAAALQEKYDAIIKEADGLLGSAEYDNAKVKYNEALAVKPTEQYPKDKLTEIDGLIAAAADQAEKDRLAAEAKALDEKYQALIDQGDQQIKDKDYASAKSSFTEAKTLKPAEQYPVDKLAEIEGLIASAAAEELDASYNDKIAAADDLMKEEKYEEAKGKYNEALGIKPDEQYPKDKIAEADQLIAAAADQAEKDRLAAIQKQYDEAIQLANQALMSKEYETARAKYNEALTIKPEEQYPKDRLAEIDGMIQADADAREKERLAAEAAALEEKYENFIREGDKKFKSKDYEAAKTAFQGALGIKPGEEYPTSKISEIDGLLSEMASQAEAEAREKQYADLIDAADDAFKAENFDEAKSSYNQALAIKSSETYPQEQIAKIDQILAERNKIALSQQRDKEYQQLVDDGERAFGVESYSEAKTSFQKALDIKPEEEYPKKRIKEIDDLLAQLEANKQLAADAAARKEEQYQALVAEGDEALGGKDYDKAINKYQAALGIKPSESYPQSKIDEINQILEDRKAALASLQAQEEVDMRYKALVSDADIYFNRKKYERAKSIYGQALTVKPNEEYPRDKIKEIDDLLSAMEPVADEPMKKAVSTSGSMGEDEIAAMMAKWQNERDAAKTEWLETLKTDLEETEDERASDATETRTEAMDELAEVETAQEEMVEERSGLNEQIYEVLMEDVDDINRDEDRRLSAAEEGRKASVDAVKDAADQRDRMYEAGAGHYEEASEKILTYKIEYIQQEEQDSKEGLEHVTETSQNIQKFEQEYTEELWARNDQYEEGYERIKVFTEEWTESSDNNTSNQLDRGEESYAVLDKKNREIEDELGVKSKMYEKGAQEFRENSNELDEDQQRLIADAGNRRDEQSGNIKEYHDSWEDDLERRTAAYDENSRLLAERKQKIEEYESNLMVKAEEKRLDFDRNYYRGEKKPRYPNEAREHGEGITEETLEQDGAIILKRTVVQDGGINVYEKIFYKWGGVYYKKNGVDSSEAVWKAETQ